MTHQLDLFDTQLLDLNEGVQEDPTAATESESWADRVAPNDFRLAELQLLGRGSALVESVKSYFMRLAQAHSYHTNDMVKLIGRHSALSHQCPKDWLGRFHDTAFTDVGVAEDWLPAVAARNGITHLGEGLVASWGSLLGKNRGSGIWTTRWCGHCLEQSHRAGQTYLPVAWSIGIVTACPVHETVLETVCHHCGAGQTPTGKGTRRFAMHAPGVCGTCSEWLGTCDPRDPDQPPRRIALACEEEVRVAVQIGSLLERPMAQDESFGVHRVLTEVCERHFAGSITRLAQWVGLNKSTVHGWLQGTVLPEIGRLVKLASRLQITVRDLVVGCDDNLPNSLCEEALGLASRERSAPRGDEKRQALQEIFATESDVSVREAARRLEMSHRDVYYHLATEATKHSEDRRQVHGQVRDERDAKAQRAVFTRLAEVRNDPALVTVRELRASAASGSPTLSYAQQQATVHKVFEALAA